MNYFNGRFDIEDGGYHDETPLIAIIDYSVQL